MCAGPGRFPIAAETNSRAEGTGLRHLVGATLRKDQWDTYSQEAILSHFYRFSDRLHHKYLHIQQDDCVEHSVPGGHPLPGRKGPLSLLRPSESDTYGSRSEEPKEFYVLSQAILAQIQSLERHKQQLLSRVNPQHKAVPPVPFASQFDLPGISSTSGQRRIKWEQRLRTKAMREKEDIQRDVCALPRSRAELVSVLFRGLSEDWLSFQLLAAGGQNLSEVKIWLSLSVNWCSYPS
ncbi:hypothetical protein QTO34_008467 [Cnephaeus nilssonii]|uniref:Uncharacterized protein n=1 Tax=Cnephaeus nilssonii TaxID=3371016 RepID=A0AA40IAC4_CNENI|nr:hypothetical protein QTO34_008467 [Eptesicus nilssonii]